MHAADFFTLPPSLEAFAEYFPPTLAPWEWIRKIALALQAQDFGNELPPHGPGVHFEGFVHLDPTVKLPPMATLIGPLWIGARTEIRPGAYLRGNVITGEDCVLGNSCEFKNCLLMDRVQVPHFNYVGDSILGNRAHLGAGAICSNFRLDHSPVTLHLPTGAVNTGLRKFGAIIGDEAEVGCNAVLNPGTLLGPKSLVMPLTSFGGWLAPATIAREKPEVTTRARRG